MAGEPFQPQAFAHPIAFNLIPQIGSHKEQGYTSEEMKMVYETRKIIGDDSILVCPTCVRVPVSNCHSESVLVETERKLSVDEARRLFAAFPGIKVVDDLSAKSYPMPSTCDDRDEVFVGRIREDLSSPNGLAFWCVSDNLRKGAATNAVQIAELLVAKGAEARGRGAPLARPRRRDRLRRMGRACVPVVSHCRGTRYVNAGGTSLPLRTQRDRWRCASATRN